MKRILFIMLALVLAIGMMPTLAFAAAYSSGDKISTTGENTLAWTGQGATPGGALKKVECDASNTPYLLWVFETDGGSAEATPGSTPQLTLGGSGSGTYNYTFANSQNSTFHFVTPYFTPDSSLEAVVYFYTMETGNGAYNLVISHGCPGDVPPPPQAELTVVKFYDANANGQFDFGEPLLEPPSYNAWKFAINGDPYETPISEVLDRGIYNITELMPIEPCWVASNVTVVGTTAYTIVSPTEVEVTLADKDAVTVYFGNYCLVPSGGLTMGFWSNKNGQATMNDGSTMAPELALLSGLNLRNAAGGHFDPVNYAPFKNWLLSATATNMAYMLSAQLAAMELNVEAGFVNGNAFYIPYGGTINQLMAEANAELGLHGTAYATDTWRGYQEMLKNYLDALNNGASVVNPAPCTYTFP